MAQLSVYNPEGSRVMSREQNQSPYQFDRNITRHPDSVITIFTVNTREQYSVSGGRKFAGREAGERFRKVGSINDPSYFVDSLSIEGSRDQNKVTADDGRWVAMDWLNPNNVFNLDQDFVTDAPQDGTNLLERGLFFIVRPYDPKRGNIDDQPTDGEIKQAESRLHRRYNALIRLYQTTSTSAPGNIPKIMSEEMIDALNFGNIKTVYNTNAEQRVVCATCGDSKPATAKFHKSESLGVICIEPTTEGWKAAVSAGIKKRDEVPEGLGWPGRA